jgi:hypothetical protein
VRETDVHCIQSARFSFQSPELGPPTPLTASECCSPPFGSKGEDTQARGQRGGGPNSADETDTLVLFVYYNPSTLRSKFEPNCKKPEHNLGLNLQWQAIVTVSLFPFVHFDEQ